MRARGAAIQGGLAALGLVAAYATWQREPERATGEVVVVDASKGDLTKVRYDDGQKWVELESRKEAGVDGPAVWLKIAANEKAKTPERVVRGNEGALKLWEKLAPLRATRALGVLTADKLKELGLDQPKKHVEVTARGRTWKFVGGSPAFNVSEPYVQDEGDKRVYVLGGGVMSDLDAASVRLVDRTLHTFKQTDFDALTVTAGAKKRELDVTDRTTPMTVKLVSKKSGKTDEQAKNWHDKLWRQFVTDVLGQGEKPAGGEPQVALRIEYRERGKDRGFIEIGRVTAPPKTDNVSAPTPPQPQTEAYARTEHTAGWVKLPPSAEDLLKEADKIASGE
jgi:hypothetical protein